MISQSYRDMVKSRIEGRSDQLLELQIRETLRFLSITSLTSGRRLPITPDVDIVWHELILQTVSYHQLCMSLPGGEFIHHESITPAEYNERVGDDRFVEEWVQWIPDYVQNFGPFTRESADCWNVVLFLEQQLGLSLEKINKMGLEEISAVSIPTPLSA